MKKKIGYARTSTASQTGRSQITALKAAGCEKIFHDRGVSGGAVIRPQLDAAIRACKPGDTLVVTAYDRLARSLRFLLDDVDRIHKADLHFESLREQVDTNTAMGALFFHIAGAFAEFERQTIQQRTKEGVKAAIARGKRPGRPSAITDERWKELKPLLKAGNSINQVARIAGVNRMVISRRIKADQEADDE